MKAMLLYPMRYLFLALVLVAAIGGTAIFCASTKDPMAEIDESKRADVEQCVNNIKSLPKGLQEAMLAEMSEFIFMDDGSLPYTNNGALQYDNKLGVHYKLLKGPAKYVDSNGKAFVFYDMIDKRNKNERWTATWHASKQLIEKVGWKTIAPFFASEIKVLEDQYAKHLGL